MAMFMPLTRSRPRRWILLAAQPRRELPHRRELFFSRKGGGVDRELRERLDAGRKPGHRRPGIQNRDTRSIENYRAVWCPKLQSGTALWLWQQRAASPSPRARRWCCAREALHGGARYTLRSSASRASDHAYGYATAPCTLGTGLPAARLLYQVAML